MRNSSKLLLIAFAALLTASCGNGKYDYPFQNPKLKTEKRVADLTPGVSVPFVLFSEGG